MLTIIIVVISAPRSNPRISRSDHNRNTLHAKLHELVALALLVVSRQVVLLLAVRDGDDIGRFVDTTLQFALVAKGVGIRIYWIDGGVTGLAESTVRAVRPINGIEEGVQETTSTLETRCIEDVVSLKKDAVLWINDRV